VRQDFALSWPANGVAEEVVKMGGVNWKLFLKRAWAGPVVGLIWLIESMYKHDSTGAALAVMLGFILGPAIAYIWTVRAP
jgi:hypothetical protein